MKLTKRRVAIHAAGHALIAMMAGAREVGVYMIGDDLQPDHAGKVVFDSTEIARGTYDLVMAGGMERST